MIPISLITHWGNSVVYVSALSLWALVAGHWSTWRAARVEVTQKREAEEWAQQDIPAEVVDRIVENTTLETEETGNNATPARS